MPSVDAAAYAVYDVSSGKFLAEQSADEQRAVGSVMKLLTAHVVMEAGDPTKVVTVPDLQMDPMESAIGLYPGEQLSREVLLRAMLIVSANDAARTLAVDVGGTQDAFVGMMNDAAQTLGLTNTRASNPVGLDSDSAYSSARDMVQLAELLMQDPTFRATVVRPSANLHGQTFPATNDLLTTLQRCRRDQDRTHHRRRLLPGGVGHPRRASGDRCGARFVDRRGTRGSGHRSCSTGRFTQPG